MNGMTTHDALWRTLTMPTHTDTEYCRDYGAFLERVPGRGTFVAQRSTQPVAALTSFSEDMRRRGRTPSSQSLLARVG